MRDPNTLHCPHCNQTWPLTPEQANQYAGQTITCTACAKPFAVSATMVPGDMPAQPAMLPAYREPIDYASRANSGGSNGMAVASLVCGCLFFIPILPAILATIFGILGISKANRDPRVRGRGLAIAGLTLGIASVVLWGFLTIGILPSIGRSNQISNRVKCSSNMRQIGLACVLYANENRGNFPPRLEDALINEDITSDAFCCPSTNDTAAPGPDHKQQAAKLSAGGHLSYVYLGSGQNVSVSDNTVLMYEPLTNHNGDGINILYADCHVEFLPKAQAQKLIARVTANSPQPVTWPPP
jgi:prepilin-type processing-associated H-X9-DG protein